MGASNDDLRAASCWCGRAGLRWWRNAFSPEDSSASSASPDLVCGDKKAAQANAASRRAGNAMTKNESARLPSLTNTSSGLDIL